jgi:hypothetical protein
MAVVVGLAYVYTPTDDSGILELVASQAYVAVVECGHSVRVPVLLHLKEEV